MNPLHIKIMRALVAAQVALIEHADESWDEHKAKKALEDCIKEAAKLVKKLTD